MGLYVEPIVTISCTCIGLYVEPIVIIPVPMKAQEGLDQFLHCGTSYFSMLSL